jgi:glycosyltransferase involved in cell wall biosynthesis
MPRFARRAETARRRLRIAICLAHFHPVVGGAERQMFQLAERWAQWDQEPVVFTRTAPGLPRREFVSGIEIRRVIRTWPLGPLFGLSFIGSLAASLLRSASRFDVVLNGQVPWEAVATGLVCPIVGKRSVVIPASTGPSGDVRQIVDAKGSWLLRRLVLNNDLFVALSSQARAELFALGCRPGHVCRMGNGVDIDRFCPATGEDSQRDRTVVFVGRLVDAKNPHVLLRAWQRVNSAGKYRLLIAGDGPLAGELRDRARRQGLAGVEWLGQVDDIPSLHRQASVFVLPSPSEGCSNALLEAMASGLCPVVSRVPGNIDLVRGGVNGLFFNHDNDAELAEALGRALEDSALRRRLAQGARDYVVAHHDLDKIAGELLDACQMLAAKKRRGVPAVKPIREPFERWVSVRRFW